jgi:Domain of unknown function (DUF2357)/PD-(D/E)XK nuclease superfamily
MTTPTLQIRPRKGSDPPMEREGRIVLQGERGWIISGDSAQIDRAAQTLGPICERFENTLLVAFGNMVGRITIPGLGVVEVVSGKWGEQHFEHMLADLAAIATELPFSADQPTWFPYDRSVLAREELRYHLFVYLRHILSPAAPRDYQLLPALQAILQQPLQRFESIRRDVPLAAAQRIDQHSLLRIAAGADGLIRAGTIAAAHTPIARALDGYLPRSVNERHITHSPDTPENRFVKSFLQLCTGIIEGMRQTLDATKTTDAFRLRIRDECAEMEKTLAPLARHPFWQEVGPMLYLSTGSTVLQGRRGYRDIYRHFVRLRLAAQIPLDERELHDLLESKDIAHLYEIWCYFTMVRLVRELLGSPTHADRPRPKGLQMAVPHEFAVTWKDGVRLRYNPRYIYGIGAGRSYSVPLRPDIALHIDGTTPHTHLFDAKFRLDQIATLLPNNADISADDEADEVAEERRGTFKRADIYKMHTYRDALHGTGSVWVLYPGSENRFYSTAGTRSDPTLQPLPDLIEGVGAIALRPEDDGDAALRTVLKHLLESS